MPPLTSFTKCTDDGSGGESAKGKEWREGGKGKEGREGGKGGKRETDSRVVAAHALMKFHLWPKKVFGLANEGGIGSDEGLVSKHTVKKDTHDIIKLMLRNQVKFIHSRG